MDGRLMYGTLFFLYLGLAGKVVSGKQCNTELWDDAWQGRGVKRVDISCESSQIKWHGPYGGIRIYVAGPEQEHQLCMRASTELTDAVVMLITKSSMTRILYLNETIINKNSNQTSTYCLRAVGQTQLFVEPSIGSPVSGRIVIDLDIERNPRFGEEACRPCTDEELLWHYCTSDFVAIGRMLPLKEHTSETIIPVSIDYVKQQSVKFFTPSKEHNAKLYGELYAPSNCGMQFGEGQFIFMGRHKFGRAYLRCAPTFDDYELLQRTSRLKGTLLCT